MLSVSRRPSHFGTLPSTMPVSTPPVSSGNKQIEEERQPTTTPPNHRHLWIITGPAGCGKSTVAKEIADYYGYPYIEGDEYHPKNNIDKMAAGIPLTDEDRWDWLRLLRQESTIQLHDHNTAGVVLTCSALKVKYRDELRKASANDAHVLVHFIYLEATEDLLLARVKARQGHYMKDSMVSSQFRTLEPPVPEETDVFGVDVTGSMQDVQNLAIDVVARVLRRDETDSSVSDEIANAAGDETMSESTGPRVSGSSTPASSVAWDELDKSSGDGLELN